MLQRYWHTRRKLLEASVLFCCCKKLEDMLELHVYIAEDDATKVA